MMWSAIYTGLNGGQTVSIYCDNWYSPRLFDYCKIVSQSHSLRDIKVDKLLFYFCKASIYCLRMNGFALPAYEYWPVRFSADCLRTATKSWCSAYASAVHRWCNFRSYECRLRWRYRFCCHRCWCWCWWCNSSNGDQTFFCWDQFEWCAGT